MSDPAVPAQTPAGRGLWLNLLIAFEAVQGLLLGAVGIVLIGVRDDRELRVDLESSAAGVGALGVFIAVIGVIHLVVSVGLVRRSEVVRSFLAAVATVQASVAVFALISRQDIRVLGALPFLSAGLVLWVLYGSDRTRGFFEQ